MKYRFLSIFLLVFIMQSVNSQTETNLDLELSKKVNIPNSPEAQAFAKYGNTPVNLYHGTPNIQVPLYTHKGRELDLPMSLTYDASGIKVEQLASQVGLAWNLNIGGRVSRVANAAPDDYHWFHPDSTVNQAYTSQHYYSFWDDTDGGSTPVNVHDRMVEYSNMTEHPSFASQVLLTNYFEFLYGINKNKYETQPDYYTFNALGFSETVIIDPETRQAKSLDNPKTKVEFYKANLVESKSPIQGWKITTEDGTQFYFNHDGSNQLNHLGVEITRSTRDAIDVSNYGLRKEYTSSWLLTKIVSPTGKDTYRFYYDHAFSSNLNLKANNFTGVKNKLTDDLNALANNPNVVFANMGYNTETYTIEQRMLSKIEHNGKTIVKVDALNARYDALTKAVDKIHIYDQDTGVHSADLFKSYDFNYDYFRTSDLVAPATSPIKSRLKLEGIDINDSNDAYVSSYYFNYIGACDIAPLTSMGQDYYGYNNGNHSATVLYPKYKDVAYGIDTPDGNDRAVNSNLAKHGMLNKITYPTGGYTEFEFESNYIPKPNGTQTQWQYRETAQVVYPTTFPTVDPNACNAYSPSIQSDVTPVVDIKSFHNPFESTSYRLTFTKLHNENANVLFYSPEHIAVIVKVADASTVLTWQDIFDANCAIKLGVDVVWQLDDLSNETDVSYIDLPEGHYRMIVSNPSQDFSHTLQLDEGIGVTIYEQEKKAGIRVKDIKDYTSDDVLAIHKTYQYPNGKVISDPQYTYTKRIEINLEVSQTYPIQYMDILYRMSYASGTNKPHIGYSAVNEIMVDHINPEKSTTNSYTFYTTEANQYYSGINVNYNHKKEQVKTYSTNYELGKPKGSRVGGSNSYSSTSETNYITIPITTPSEPIQKSVKGIYLEYDETMQNRYPYPLENTSNNTWSIDWMPPHAWATFASPTFGDGIDGLWWTAPIQCNEWSPYGNQSELCKPEMGRVLKRIVHSWPKTGGVSTQKTRQTFDVSGRTLEQIATNAYYGHDQKFLLKESTTTDSYGETMTQEYLYPDNFVNEYTALKANNMISAPVETKTYKDTSQLLSSQKTEYDGTIFPKRIKTAKGNHAYEERLAFEEYRDGNVVQVRQADGTPSVYIWGYDQRYVIAKVENATLTDVEALPSFTSNFVISVNLTTQQEADLRAMPDAMVSTYVYDPVVGVIKMTDTNGQTINYNYDDYHRLEQITDKDDYILKTYDYNYRATAFTPDACTIPPPVTLSADYITISVDNSSSVPNITYSGSIIGQEGGVAPYTYSWSYQSVNSGGSIPLGSAPTFTLEYQSTDASEFCGTYDPSDPNSVPPNITFYCTITDSDNPNNSITLTKVIQATCTNNQQ